MLAMNRNKHLLDLINVDVFLPVSNAGLGRVTGAALQLLSSVLHIYSCFI